MGFSGVYCPHHEFLFLDVILVTDIIVSIFIVTIISVVRGQKSLLLVSDMVQKLNQRLELLLKSGRTVQC